MIAKINKLLLAAVFVLNTAACTFNNSDGPPWYPVDVSHVKEPTPKVEPKSKYGNPNSYVVFGKRYHTLDNNQNFVQTGIASWYGTKFHGRRTSSGEEYDMYALTGAHKTLPLPTYARVTNLDNNKSIIIKINDRGPFHDNRIVDLSYAAASKLGVLAKGTANVKLTAIDPKKLQHTKNLIQLQIGAFSEKKRAEKLINTVTQVLEHPVSMSKVSSKNKNVFKVNIGPFPENKVDYVKSKLATLNILNPITIAQNYKI